MRGLEQMRGSSAEQEREPSQGFLKLSAWLLDHKILGGSDRSEKAVIKGNPDIGTVVWFRQFHRTSEDATNPNCAFAVGMYQARILDDLSKGRYDAVFSEDDTLQEQAYVSEYGQRVREEFSGPFDPDRPTRAQLRLLHDCGADVVYGILHPDVQLFSAQNPLLSVQSHLLGKEHARTSAGAHPHFYARERYAAMKVRQFLDAHPGSRVALVYGAAHNFRFDLKRDRPLEGSWTPLKQFGQRAKEDVPSLREVVYPRALDMAHLAIAWDSNQLLRALSVLVDGPTRALEASRRDRRAEKAQPRMQRKVDAVMRHISDLEARFGDVALQQIFLGLAQEAGREWDALHGKSMPESDA